MVRLRIKLPLDVDEPDLAVVWERTNDVVVGVEVSAAVEMWRKRM